MNIPDNFPKELVSEVAVFHAPGIDKWVTRCFGFGQVGDLVSNEKPTEEQLKAEFGESLLITWGYAVISTAATNMMAAKMREAGWRPNLDVILTTGNNLTDSPQTSE